MSIAITAPEKFDFQDLVSIQLGLRFLGMAGTLVVEPQGGEDATLSLTREAGPRTFEIQVKGADGTLGIIDLADYLLHFPDSQHEGSLFERLLNDTDRAVVFVVSARCDDSTSKFVVPTTWSGEEHPAGRLTQTNATALIAALKPRPLEESASDLQKRRAETRQKLAEALKPRAIAPLLHRILILEQITSAIAHADCEQMLRTNFNVPSDAASDLINRLRNAVKTAKRARADVLPHLQRELQASAKSSVVSPGYVERGTEAAWVKQLSRDRILLLSGATRTGKTESARRVASEFQPHGYDVQEFAEAEAALRYLADTVAQPRLAVLDDPLGAISTAPNANRTLERIRAIVGRMPVNRRLIISQSQEQLFLATKRERLFDIPMQGLQWIDAGESSAEFRARLWRSIAHANALPEEPLATALSDGSVVLAPGSLHHLALSFERLGRRTNLHELVRLAQEDAESLSLTLAETPGIEHLMAALAVGTGAEHPIAVRELAFLVGAGGAGLPGRPHERILGGITLGGPARVAKPLPQYDRPPAFDEEFARHLETLERLQIVTRTREGALNFSHPFYRMAGELVFDRATNRMGDVAHRIAERALFCNASRTSRAAAKNLEWLFSRLAHLPDEITRIVSLAIEGLRSYFPGTRDLCLQFLIRHLETCTPDQRRNMPNWVSAATSVEISALQWVDGEAHLPVDGFADGREYLAGILSTVKREDIEQQLRSLQGKDDTPLAPEQIIKPLLYFALNVDQLDEHSMGRLLSFDEAVIRAEATRIWLSASHENDDAILGRIFSDDHPSVLEAALEGTTLGWNTWSAARRDDLTSRLATAAVAPASAAVLLEKLVVFDRVEYTGDNPPWLLYAVLVPVVLRALPLTAWVNDARLYASMESAVGRLPAKDVISICDAWLDWVDRNLIDGRLQSDFSLAAVDFIIGATRSTPELRAKRVQRLLSFDETGALLVFIKDLVDEWKHLTSSERAFVLDKLAGSRRDRCWLQATALTRRAVPSEIERVILGEDLRLADRPAELISKIDPQLLEACVAVQCGRPQPLWALGIHHPGAQVWIDVIDHLLRNPGHPQFRTALEDQIYQHEDNKIAATVAVTDSQYVDLLFELLLQQKTVCAGNWLSKSWKTLLARVTDEPRRSTFFGRMAAAAPAILDDLSDLGHWLIDEEQRLALFTRLSGDAAARYFLIEFRKVFNCEQADDKVQDLLVSSIAELLSEEAPRLHGTCSELTCALRTYGVADGILLDQIEERRLLILEGIKHLRADADIERPTPSDWIGPS